GRVAPCSAPPRAAGAGPRTARPPGRPGATRRRPSSRTPDYPFPAASAAHCSSRAAEDHSFVAVHENAMLDEATHRARESYAFGVAADRREHFRRVGVVHALDDLLDDRALVQVGGDVLSRL